MSTRQELTVRHKSPVATRSDIAPASVQDIFGALNALLYPGAVQKLISDDAATETVLLASSVISGECLSSSTLLLKSSCSGSLRGHAPAYPRSIVLH